MSLRYLAPLAMAAAAAAEWGWPRSPRGRTGPFDQCTATGNSTVCQRPGRVSTSPRRRWFPPAVPVSPISGGPHALRERLTPVALRSRSTAAPCSDFVAPAVRAAPIHAPGRLGEGEGRFH